MAIKVNGTTVINDSRALTNIASVDATTATAIGNAGVGGSLVFISETSITSTVAYIEYTFPSGYRGFEFSLNCWTNDLSTGDTRDLLIRFTDSSGSLITTGAEYSNGAIGVASAPVADYIEGPRISGNVTPSYGKVISVKVMFPLQTNINTSFFLYGAGFESRDGGAYTSAAGRYGGMKVPEANTKIRFYPALNNIHSSSQSYSVWGIK